jgi:hypothetical protein
MSHEQLPGMSRRRRGRQLRLYEMGRLSGVVARYGTPLCHYANLCLTQCEGQVTWL